MKNRKAQIRTKKTKGFQALIRSKKAQIRMTETIAVLFIFFILILFGIIFYYKYSQISFEEQQEELLGKKATEITLQTLFLPELACTRGEAEAEDNCFDVLKLDHAQKIFEDNFKDYYFDLFPYVKISVTQVYPLDAGEQKKWLLYDKPKPEWTRLENTSFIITLKDLLKKEGSEYRFGYLTVEVYS